MGSVTYTVVPEHELVWYRASGEITFDNNVLTLVAKGVSYKMAEAARVTSLLDGQVPYAICPGNHDYGPSGNASTRDSLFNSPGYYGPGSPYAGQPSIGGFFEAGVEPLEASDEQQHGIG